MRAEFEQDVTGLFCDKVDQILEYQYGLSDGGDLCFNLIEMGVIKITDDVNQAARVVAQHIQQA